MRNQLLILSIPGIFALACGGQDFAAPEELAETIELAGPGPIGGDPCLTSYSDYFRILGPNIDSVRATGTTTDYATRSGCKKEIIDIRVPSTSSPADVALSTDVEFYGQIMNLDLSAFNSGNCNTISMDAWRYSAPSFPLGPTANPFGVVDSIRGVWSSGSCKLRINNTDWCNGTLCRLSGQISPPATGSVTYRLLLSAQVGTLYHRVRGIGAHVVPPPT
jgi:hypothetical protein